VYLFGFILNIDGPILEGFFGQIVVKKYQFSTLQKTLSCHCLSFCPSVCLSVCITVFPSVLEDFFFKKLFLVNVGLTFFVVVAAATFFHELVRRKKRKYWNSIFVFVDVLHKD
jgi:hypothetical protein